MSKREDALDLGTGDPGEGDDDRDGDGQSQGDQEPRYSPTELLEMRRGAYDLAARYGNADEGDVDLHEPGSAEDRAILEGFGPWGKTVADGLEEHAKTAKAHEEALAANELRDEDAALLEEARKKLADERAKSAKAAALERAKQKVREEEAAAAASRTPDPLDQAAAAALQLEEKALDARKAFEAGTGTFDDMGAAARAAVEAQGRLERGGPENPVDLGDPDEWLDRFNASREEK